MYKKSQGPKYPHRARARHRQEVRAVAWLEGRVFQVAAYLGLLSLSNVVKWDLAVLSKNLWYLYIPL
jgi:hypothetical protein